MKKDWVFSHTVVTNDGKVKIALVKNFIECPIMYGYGDTTISRVPREIKLLEPLRALIYNLLSGCRTKAPLSIFIKGSSIKKVTQTRSYR